MTTVRQQKPIRPGARPGRNSWCQWLQAVYNWPSGKRAAAREKANRAYGSRSIRAQYAALSEMRVIDEIEAGTFKHIHHCAALQGCPVQWLARDRMPNVLDDIRIREGEVPME